jgi:hypothetical protein
MKYYLTHGISPHCLDPKNKISLRIKSVLYHLIQGVLFHINNDDVYLRCLEKEDADTYLSKLHGGLVGGHFRGDTTSHKILRVGFYCPTLFKESYTFARKCKECQRSIGEEKKVAFPL